MRVRFPVARQQNTNKHCYQILFSIIFDARELIASGVVIRVVSMCRFLFYSSMDSSLAVSHSSCARSFCGTFCYCMLCYDIMNEFKMQIEMGEISLQSLFICINLSVLSSSSSTSVAIDNRQITDHTNLLQQSILSIIMKYNCIFFGSPSFELDKGFQFYAAATTDTKN